MRKVSDEKIAELEDLAYEIRRLTLRLMDAGRLGHPGGSFSETEILTSLFFEELKLDPENPRWDGRDRFILSKAHACNALYATLAKRGFFPEEECLTYAQINSRLQGHSNRNTTPGVEMSGGSLGQGLSYACGTAYALRKKKNFSHVFCLIGDGESQEGMIMEAAMSAAQYKLDNLTAIMDYNKVQAKDYVYNTRNIEPVRAKWEAFGWNVLEVDGHDMRELLEAYYEARWQKRNGKPTIIIANTVKGHGIEWFEFNTKWHTFAPTGEDAQLALRDLAAYYGKSQEAK